MTREKCLGWVDHSVEGWPKPIIECDNFPEEDEDWCESCGEKMMSGFKRTWANIAQEEAPNASREDIEDAIDKIVPGVPKG